MMNDKELNQNGGDNATNQQALRIKNVYKNYGPTEAQLLESQIEVFNRNMPVLAQAAAEIISERASEFLERFIIEKLCHDPQLLVAFADPGIQWATLEAQKHYAKTGDKNVFDILIDLLGERIKQNERTTLQIALDESLSVAPKLTQEHLDVLSLFISTKYLEPSEADGIAGAYKYMDGMIRPFVNGLVKKSACISHLTYMGCIIPTRGGVPSSGGAGILYKLARHYPDIGDTDNILASHAIALIENKAPYMSHFNYVYDNYVFDNYLLTSVGIAIAAANIKRKTNYYSVNLPDYIN